MGSDLYTLKVSEQFYSLQGEGPNSGQTSIFLRLQGCNLTCGGKKTIQTGGLDSGATWRCDTIDTWLKGDKKSFEEILAYWKKQRWTQASRLVITGGEPLLQKAQLSHFFEKIKKVLPKLCIEIETNGTIMPPKSWEAYCVQYNVSPKLSNSGMLVSKRLCSDTLDYFSSYPNAIFKLVISKLSDYIEFKKDVAEPFKLKPNKIWLMPAADTKNQLNVIAPQVAQIALDHFHHFSNRLHIYLWDQKTGV